MKFFKRKVVSFALVGTMLAGLLPSALSFSGNTMSAKAATNVPSDFVYANGTQFMKDGSPYYYGGTNCYYLTYKSPTSVQNVMNDCNDMGLNVIRIWGNLDVGKKTDKLQKDNKTPVFEGNNDGEGSKDGVYFQYWDDEQKKPVVNEGENGLRRLDYVISEAEKHNLKLIITFTNYWEAFGGMGQYVKYLQMLNGTTPASGQVQEKDVCEFYTNETIKGWYKDYINTLLNHENYYTKEKLKDSSAVFSWELANEPRCTIDGNGSEFCQNDILYKWAKEMSEYVKSIDSNHMVSIGDEGFYNYGFQEANKIGPSAVYSGYYGVDFEKLMTIDTIDFGTPHMYIDQWGFTGDNDLDWIKRHAQTTQNANKPIIFEEFGVKDKTIRDTKYENYLSIVTGDKYEGIEYQGFNYWMIASFVDDNQQKQLGNTGKYYYQDYDQYTVYGPADVDAAEGSPKARSLIIDAAAKMNAKNSANSVSFSATTIDVNDIPTVTAELNIQEGRFGRVTYGENTLQKGTDYTISGDTITFADSFIEGLGVGSHKFEFYFSNGDVCPVTLKIKDGTTGGDDSSNPDIGTGDDHSGEVLVLEKTVSTEGWSTVDLAEFDFTGYESATIELKGSTSFNNFYLTYGGSKHDYYIGASSLTAKLDGSVLSYKTLPTISEVQGAPTTISVEGQQNTYTLKIYAKFSHEHEFTEEIVKPATCEKDGTKKLTCSICGYSKTEVIKATGHNYVTTVVEPTKTEDGYTLHKCSNCGDEYKDNIINKTGTTLPGVIGFQQNTDNTAVRFVTVINSSDAIAADAAYYEVKVNDVRIIKENITSTYKTFIQSGQKVTAPAGKNFIISSNIRDYKPGDSIELLIYFSNYDNPLTRTIKIKKDSFNNLDTEVTASTRENFADYANTISNVDINGDKLYSQDDLEKNFGTYGNLYDKSLYDNGEGSDVGIVFCGWNSYNYLQDPTLDYKLKYFEDNSEYGVKRMTFIPTYFIDTYSEGIKLNNKDTLTPDEQADILVQAIDRNVSINYRLHIDPQRFAPNGDTYNGKVDTSVPGSQWWRGEFTQINPMGEDYLGMIDQGFETLEKTLKKTGTDKLVEPIRFDIGAELMTSIKNYTKEWNELVEYCRKKVDSSELLKDNVLISYNFCHHIEYLIELENHDNYFGRINGTGVTYKDRQDLLFVDDMTEANRKLLGEFIMSLDTFTISQYMPMDIFESSDLKDIDNIKTTPEDVRDALLTHEQNFLQKILIGKLGIEPDKIPPLHIGEYGMGIKGMQAPNVWDRTAWTDEELATYEVQQKHAEIALKGLMLYMQDERSVAKSLALWISGAPYDVINFYPGMNIGDAGHGYPGQAAYNENAALVLKNYWHGIFNG